MSPLRVTEDELRALLVDQLELLDHAEFTHARDLAARLRLPAERVLVEHGRIPYGFLLEQLAAAWSVGFIDVKVSDVHPEALRTVSEDYARRHALIPFESRDRQIHLAMCDPRDRYVVAEVEQMTGLRVVPHLAPETAVRRAHLLYRGDLRTMLERSAAFDDGARPAIRPGGDEPSAAELLTRLLEYAAVTRASDIHLETFELEGVVRYRIDGVLREVVSLPRAALPALIARIKVLAQLRIDERRAPQDGHFEADLGGFKLDLRVSSLPTLWGEKVVMRVLPKEGILLDLEDLGLSAADHRIVQRNVTRPHGMILVTGPTGSGKTTSLYAMLSRIAMDRQNRVNISTIEDPVEYTMPRVNQVTVNPTAGMEFASGLRALLRQDPDVIIVGEIRDRETAEIAIRAALVGRLLLSTLHTNDAPGAVPRLLDMGMEPFLVASTLALVVAQRLVRRICVSCRESVSLDPVTLEALRSREDFEGTVQVLRRDGVLGSADDPLSAVRLFRGKGCDQCQGTGFRGRVGVFELFEVDEGTRGLIMARQDAGRLRDAAVARGMKTMFQDGLGKALLGETTVDEVLRVAL